MEPRVLCLVETRWGNRQPRAREGSVMVVSVSVWRAHQALGQAGQTVLKWGQHPLEAAGGGSLQVPWEFLAVEAKPWFCILSMIHRDSSESKPPDPALAPRLPSEPGQLGQREEEAGIPWPALTLLQATMQNILSQLLPWLGILIIPLCWKSKDVLSWQCWWWIGRQW